MVILSHGYGADCNDLISIGEHTGKDFYQTLVSSLPMRQLFVKLVNQVMNGLI
jgi:hypothetical protein